MNEPVGFHARFLATIILGLTTLSSSPILLAQTSSGASGNNNGKLAEVVVTAQFRKQNLQQTPVAITAVNSKMLQARSQTNISQVANEAPNVTLKPQGQAYGPSMAAYIRGIGQYDFDPAFEPGVGLYVDDVYYGSLTGSVFDLLDLDRVEILRGPQGTLAGMNSIGGAIKLFSKKPGEGDSKLAVTYGSRHRLDFRGSADFKVGKSIGVRIAGVSKKQDGYVKRLDWGCVHPNTPIPANLAQGTNCVVAKEGQVDYNGGRIMVNWDNGGPVKVTLIGDYTHDDRTDAGNVLLYANYQGTGDINPYGGNIPYDSRFVPPKGSYYNYASYISYADNGRATSRANGRTKYEGWGVSSTIDWDINDTLSLKSITAYRAWNTKFSNDDDVSPLAHSFGRGNLNYWQVSQELRLNGSFGPADQVEYTLGGLYFRQRTLYATFQDLRYVPGLTPFQGNDPVNAEYKAAFGHVSWNLTNRLTLIGGLRYTSENKNYTFSRRTRSGALHPLLGGLDGKTGTFSGDRVDYRAGIQYNWTDAIMTYAQVSTGFKGGGINPRPFFASQVRPFGEEKLRSWEIGMKSDLWQHRARVNVAAFYSNYRDIQLVVNSCPMYSPFAGAPCALPENAGDAHIKGFEVESSVRPVENLSIDGSLSYLDFNYTHIGQHVPVTKNMVPPNTPTWKWSLGAQYDIPLPGGMGTLTPRIDASYQGDIYQNAVNRPINKIKSYILANARLTWKGPEDKWEGAFQVTNLTNKYYFLTKFDLTGAGAGFVSGQPGRPREWAVTIQRNF